MPLLQSFIDEQFNGQIWKFTIDEKNGLLFAEIRNADNREVSFASINLHTGKVNFKDLQLPEKWLAGLYGGFDSVLLLHGYQSAQGPAHKGITAIDGKTGAELWSNYSYAISRFSINGPIVYSTQVQPPMFYLLDVLSGATLRPFNASIDEEIIQNIALPEILTTIPSEFNSFFSDETVGNFHYIEHNSFRIVSLHTIKNGSLRQTLLITNNGELVYRDILNDKIQKLQPEAFIVYQDQLIYIKNTRELKIFNL
jgi:hypothetical protein